MSNITYEIKRHLGTLGENEKTGWMMEANIVAWNGGSDKLDIRAWSPDHTKMSRGVTLTSDEARALTAALKDLFKEG